MPLFTDNDSVQMRQVTQEKTNLWFAHLKVFGVLTMVYREKIQCVPPNAFELLWFLITKMKRIVGNVTTYLLTTHYTLLFVIQYNN